MHIQKVLNSSVVLVQDDSGEESILLGKGIGYGRKAGEPIERQPSDRVFLPLSNPDAQPMLELFSSIPASYLELTQDIVDDAEQSLGVKLSAHIYLLLTDHLHFAVERQQKGLVVTNRIFWEIKHFYPKEYAVGQRGLQKVKAKLGIELPDEEAGNIAFHIVNARQDPQAGYDAMRAAQLIGELSNIVTYSMHCPVSTESIHYARFVSHLQYFAERFFSGKLMDSEDDFLFQQMQQNYPAAVTCAEKYAPLCCASMACFAQRGNRLSGVACGAADERQIKSEKGRAALRKAALPLGFEKGKGKGKNNGDKSVIDAADRTAVPHSDHGLCCGQGRAAEGQRQPGALGGHGVSGHALRDHQRIPDRRYAGDPQGTFVLHGYCGGYPCSAAGAQRPVEPPAQAGCRGTGECDLQQRRCTGDPVGQGSDGRCVCHLLLRIHHCAAGAAVDPRQFPFAGQQCAGLEKVLTNINMIAIAAGALLYWFRVVLPAPLQNTMSTVGNMMGPMGMLLAGMAIAEKPLREVFCTRRNYLPTVLRLVVCPLVVLVLLWVCHASSWVADGKNILMTVYLAAITPACATVTSMAQLYDRDAAHSSALYVLTTLLSIVSMPVMIGLFDLLL